MTDPVEDFLEHYGVKGMKWGQRRAEKKLAKADTKWEKNIYSMKGAIAVHNNVADKMNGSEIAKHNSNPKWSGKDITKDKKLEKAYFKEFEKVTSRVYSQAVTDVHGVSPSGKKAAFYVSDKQGERIEVRSGVEVVHADIDEPDLIIPIELNALGQVRRTGTAPKVQHSDEVDEFFAHYGVKGMKWGVRRSEKMVTRSAPSTVKEKVKPSRRGAQSIRVTNKQGGRVTTAGGKRNIATSDAVNAAVARQKAKKSTTNALTNKELKSAVERMNLEQQFNKLTKQDAKSNRGKKFIEALFKAGTGDLVGAAAAAGSATSARQISPKAISAPRKAIGS